MATAARKKTQRKRASRRSAAAGPEDLAIAYRPLASIEPTPNNPKTHDVGVIQESIRRFGFVVPVVVDEKSGRLSAGHGRIEALRLMRAADEPIPEHIRKSKNDWLVPVVSGARFKDEHELRGFLVGDNQATIAGGWNKAELAAILSRQMDRETLDGVGFNSAKVASLLRDLGKNTTPGEDDAPTADGDRQVSTAGDLWLLGRHRLLCADATNENAVRSILDTGKPAILMVTDPPYGVNYRPSWRTEAAKAGHIAFADRREGDVQNDDRVDWSEAYALFPGSVAYYLARKPVWQFGPELDRDVWF